MQITTTEIRAYAERNGLNYISVLEALARHWPITAEDLESARREVRQAQAGLMEMTTGKSAAIRPTLRIHG